jgi:hypothetical protein
MSAISIKLQEDKYHLKVDGIVSIVTKKECDDFWEKMIDKK